ncbi:MAG: PRD domain-containing protein [Merdibacter sp.]
MEKAVRILTTCLQNTLQELEIDYSDVLAIKYLCHCSNMLERVIRNESWDYPKINLFMQQHSYLLHVVEHGLEFAADAFGVKIPLTELVYVAQIFLPEE